MKKLLTAALTLTILVLMCAFSEEEEYIASETGGVIRRGTAVYRTRALIEELDVAYLDSDCAYLTKGVQTRFIVHATGGDGVYSYSFSIYRRSGTTGSFSYVASSGTTRSNSFYFTPKVNSGQYLLLIRVVDSAGSYIEWQSQVYESAEHASVMKAKSLASECMQKASTDYARALWLHDWLIMNAEYDYNYQYYYPDGVLLHGAGVCQSYALAYDMLLRLVGIESLYITGYAGGGDHGWNLVKIDGDWYHVDCTWDDPGAGMENHDYFCVSDEIMMRDHMWRHEAQIMPQCDNNDYMYAIRSGAQTCEGEADVTAILNESLLLGRSYTEIWYLGENPVFDFAGAVDAWYAQAVFPAGFLGIRYSTGSANLKMEFDFGSGYPDLSEPASMKIDISKADMEKGEGMRLLVLALPSAADISGLVWTSSNPDCIQISDGYAQAVAPGSSVISAVHPNGTKSEITLFVNSGMVISIPSFIKIIEEEAFAGNVLMETVVLPNGLTEIGSKAFYGCSLLKTVAIPGSVTSIGADAFSECGRVVIECNEGSFAHSYAVEEDIDYRLVSK